MGTLMEHGFEKCHKYHNSISSMNFNENINRIRSVMGLKQLVLERPSLTFHTVECPTMGKNKDTFVEYS